MGPSAPVAEDDNEPMNIPDVPVVDGDDAVASDATLRTRKMSKAALLLEAQSKRHLMSHFPHNPLCEVCQRAHLHQKRFARSTEREDDGLDKVTEPRTLISTDSVIIAKKPR